MKLQKKFYEVETVQIIFSNQNASRRNKRKLTTRKTQTSKIV